MKARFNPDEYFQSMTIASVRHVLQWINRLVKEPIKNAKHFPNKRVLYYYHCQVGKGFFKKIFMNQDSSIGSTSWESHELWTAISKHVMVYQCREESPWTQDSLYALDKWIKSGVPLFICRSIIRCKS